MVNTMDSRTILKMDTELYTNNIKAPAKLLIQDRCPFGQPRIVTVDHMGCERVRRHLGPALS